MSLKTAELDMGEAGCPSCAYAVEHLGRKLPGVRDVRVDIAAHRIVVLFDGEDSVLARIQDIVTRIGHDATVRSVREVAPSGELSASENPA